MCPISGLVQFLIVLVALLLMCHAVIVRSLRVNFDPKNKTLHMYKTIPVNYEITGDPGEVVDWLELYVEDTDVAIMEKKVFIEKPGSPISAAGMFNLTGNFLGKTRVSCKTSNGKSSSYMDVTVIREKQLIDTLFTASVATLVSIIYINFGCALNWRQMGEILKRPIGPIIGFCGQFLIMPLLSFGLGKALFPDNHAMQLGMFFTGVSPAGGASNIWTVVLDGNMDLSVTMTTISTFAAFGMMPLWLFTLGKLIFDQAEMKVPYKQISTYAVALVIPLAIGFLINRYLPKVGRFLTRILKGFSSLLLLFIVIFAIVANLYLFQLFSWQIVVAGMGLPYIGYMSGFLIAKLLRQPPPDCLAIGIETGIQNTGIAIFLLRFTLPQPQADLTTIAPVSVAIMTPFPLLAFYIYKKIKERLSPTHRKLNQKMEFTNGIQIENNDSRPRDDTLVATVS